MASVLVSALQLDALIECGRVQPGEAVPPNLQAFLLSRLNQIVDNWNAQREAVYCERFLTFTFVPSQQDYTIGPTGADFTVDVRPVTIDGANVLLDNVSPTVSNPINLRDYQWWMNLTVREVQTTFPTDLYYEPNYPNGILHFWPEPTTTYGVELITRVTLSPATQTGTLNMPPGYQNALMLTLAEDIGPALGVPEQSRTTLKAREARQRIFVNNTFTPQLFTQDSGMPSNNRNRCSFNYRTGLDINVNR